MQLSIRRGWYSSTELRVVLQGPIFRHQWRFPWQDSEADNDKKRRKWNRTERRPWELYLAYCNISKLSAHELSYVWMEGAILTEGTIRVKELLLGKFHTKGASYQYFRAYCERLPMKREQPWEQLPNWATMPDASRTGNFASNHHHPCRFLLHPCSLPLQDPGADFLRVIRRH